MEAGELATLHELCLEYVSTQGLSRESFHELWDEALPILRMGKRLEIEPPPVADTESFLGSGLEALEAVVLVAIGSFLADALKMGLSKALELLRDPVRRWRYVRTLGNLDGGQQERADAALLWLPERWQEVEKLVRGGPDGRNAER